MANMTPNINLLKEKEISFTDKFINWALTIGRLLVILTELIALSAFIYRFSLDRKIIDLHSKIKQEQAIVNYLKSNENNYRNLQDRLLLAANFSTSEEVIIKTFKDVLSLVPQDIIINSFYLNKNRINISANVQSASSLNRFINALKNYPATNTISLDNIDNKSITKVLTFTTTVLLK